ncbi:DUF2062 domain-containing protein [Litchfieldia salsa]|uniref:DUF2062 domain-containing protein n=1 Tax=Litchfieldia salsa TaxID=930152 RepID=A0A1H0RZ51_9BACI|nr:DUF2062 domain-containing protein [Litchfieldia salsa]SDP34218.1 hypothetical protein SAMN05216565_102433 [Litchfieldia salsa]
MLKNLQRKTKLSLLKLLRIKDSAHSVALGFTVGFIINFIPSFGLGPIISTTAARLVKGNSIAGLIGGVLFIWISPLLFYINIVVGKFFVPFEIIDVDMEIEDTEEVVSAGLTIGKAFIIGMVVNMIWVGIIIYYVIFYIIKKHRISLLELVHKKWKIKT